MVVVVVVTVSGLVFAPLCSCFVVLQMKPSELGMRFGVAFAGSFLIVLGLVITVRLLYFLHSVS